MLLFQAGTHGNFLSRCLSVASGVCDDFDFYDTYNGAHKEFDSQYKLVQHDHYPTKKDVWTYISIDESDMYYLYYHIMSAAGRLKINLFTVNDWKTLKEKLVNKEHTGQMTGGLRKQVEWFNDGTVAGLREMYMAALSKRNGCFDRQREIYQCHRIKNTIKFTDFYNWDSYKICVEELLRDLGYNYVTDIQHHWQDFFDRKLELINSQTRVLSAFDNYKNNKSYDISKFCVYEQAFLNHLIQEDLGYELQRLEWLSDVQCLEPLPAETC